MKKIVQGIKTEMKSIKKTQSDVKIETNNLGTRTKKQRQASPMAYKR